MSEHKHNSLSFIWYLNTKFLVQIQLNILTTSGDRGQMCFCCAIVIVIGTRDYLKPEIRAFRLKKLSIQVQ